MRIATPVNMIIINNKNQVLLIKRKEKEDQFEGFWSIPGGGPENKETYEEALRREIKEEINCEISSTIFFRSYFFKVNPNLSVRAIYFYGKVQGDIVVNDEFSEHRWFDIEDIHNPKYKIAFNQRDILLDFKKDVIQNNTNNKK